MVSLNIKITTGLTRQERRYIRYQRWCRTHTSAVTGSELLQSGEPFREEIIFEICLCSRRQQLRHRGVVRRILKRFSYRRLSQVRLLARKLLHWWLLH